MKLPEQMPEELYNSIVNNETVKELVFNGPSIPVYTIYSLITDHFNNQPTKWYPVSEKPEEGQIVWVTDGDIVELTSYCSSAGFMASMINECNITHWTHVKSDRPEPPKE